MGWSGYEIYGVNVSVDAHGGESEERGERLYRELKKELHDAITAIINQAKYQENTDVIHIYY